MVLRVEGVLYVTIHGIEPSVPPDGIGCSECLSSNGWWLHLRRCAQCGHVGCCDSSPSQHASHHARQTGHPVVQSFEPGEDWFWNYGTEQFYEGPTLAGPGHHPPSNRHLDLPAAFPQTGNDTSTETGAELNGHGVLLEIPETAQLRHPVQVLLAYRRGVDHRVAVRADCVHRELGG